MLVDDKLSENPTTAAHPSIGNLLQNARTAIWRVSTTLIGCAAVGYAIWRALNAYVLPVSSQAVVAGRIHVMRAPMDGNLTWKELKLGAVLPARAEAGAIHDPYASDLFVRDLSNKLEITEAELAALEPQVDRLEKFAAGLRGGANLYQLRRVEQLQSLLGETQARLEADRAKAKLAATERQRAESMLKEGVGSDMRHAESVRDLTVAEQSEATTALSLEAVKTQLEAAKQGISIDSNGIGSERPYSKQRLDEVTLELMRLRQRIEEGHVVRETLKAQRASAQARLKELSEVSLLTDSRVRAWKMMSSGGEYVYKGQPLVSLLDCETILVVATVRESVFNRLEVGSSARFKGEDGVVHRGSVVQLEGLTRATSEDSIVAPGLTGQRDPIPTSADPYRVTLTFPSLAESQRKACAIGKTGRVTFD